MWQAMSLIAFMLGAQQVELTPPKGAVDEPVAASRVVPGAAPSQTEYDLVNLPSELLNFSNGQWLEAWLATVENIDGGAIAQSPSGVQKVARSDTGFRGNAAFPDPEVRRLKTRSTASGVLEIVGIVMEVLAAICGRH